MAVSEIYFGDDVKVRKQAFAQQCEQKIGQDFLKNKCKKKS